MWVEEIERRVWEIIRDQFEKSDFLRWEVVDIKVGISILVVGVVFEKERVVVDF